MRVIWTGSVSFKVNLANSTCKRTRRPDGLLMEMVELDGNPDSMTDAELDAWVESFPIEECERNGRINTNGYTETGNPIGGHMTTSAIAEINYAVWELSERLDADLDLIRSLIF